jgi:hypothetical protein
VNSENLYKSRIAIISEYPRYFTQNKFFAQSLLDSGYSVDVYFEKNAFNAHPVQFQKNNNLKFILFKVSKTYYLLSKFRFVLAIFLKQIPVQYSIRKITFRDEHFDGLIGKIIILLTKVLTKNTCISNLTRIALDNFVLNRHTISKHNFSKYENIYYFTSTSATTTFVFAEKTLSKLLKEKLYFITEGWDNNSSKLVFFNATNSVLTMSEQTKSHLIRFSGLKDSNVHVVGNSRYLDMERIYLKNLSGITNITYKIAFMESNTVGFDNFLVFNLLSVWLLKQNNTNLKFECRIHPFSFDAEEKILGRLNIYENLLLSGKPKMQNYFDLTRKSIDTISECEFVVCGLSTVFLECVILRKPVILLIPDYQVGFRYDGLHSAFRELINFLEEQSCLFVANYYTLQKQLDYMNKNVKSITNKLCQLDINYFYGFTDYVSNLKKYV